MSTKIGGPLSPAMHFALNSVVRERAKQHEKWGEQNHDLFIWLAILHEETGELSEAVLHEKFGGPEAENIYKEAVQVAAVALQLVEFLVRRQTRKRRAKA